MKNKNWENLIGKVDKSNMFRLIADFHKQCRKAVEIADSLDLPSEYADADKIVAAGLGGSAIGGDLLFTYLTEELQVPFHVVRDYELPAFVDKQTLFLAVSYSGDTEETLSAYDEAISRSARVIGITSGGKLRKRCQRDGNPVVLIPGGMPPRAALGYLFFPMLIALEHLKFVGKHSTEREETLKLLKELSEEYSLFPDNPAVTLAQKLYGRMPVIYGSAKNTSAVACRWRTQINENSKTFASHHVFPELDHNEIVGWEKLEQITETFRVIMLRDSGDHQRVGVRMDITKAIIGNAPAGIDEIWSQGKSSLARMFSLICLGDFVSFYLALLNGVDPTPVERIQTLKKRLAGR